MTGTVAVVGLGQIGSSLAAAARKKKLARRVIGIARRSVVRRTALRIRAVHEATADLGAVADADLVVLATPVRHILKTLPAVAREMKPGALLTDVGSTKEEVAARAKQVLRRTSIGFIGGHPMAGTEKAGIAGCDARLFAGRPYILVPVRVPRPAHRRRMNGLAKGLGARVCWIDSAKEHDRIVATISHLPHLIAYTLVDLARDDRMLRLSGGSFRDATRVAQSPPEMVLDFLLTNRRALPAVSREFRKALREVTAASDLS
ncbi:MAG: prephenate dehydrogenase [Planctomycetota bacterium]|jgi:prephenate dehydrogenase